jgi:23S rRNA pseudouridine1911/1915/1917 synthase
VADRIEIVVNPQANKKRLDEFLFGRFGGLSKMYLRHIVKNEKCEVNGRPENVGYRVRENDFIEIELDLTRETAMRPQDLPIEVIYEDTELIVVNKAAGMLVHPTNRDKSGTLLNALTFYLNRDQGDNGLEMIRPGLIHRLDKQTSGLIVIAKTQKAHTRMTEFFRKKFVEKRYLALVDGVVEQDSGVIDEPIGRFGDLKHWDVKADGKSSQTRFWVRQRNVETTLLELEPVTGRTNQLRIHCAAIGHPIVGDVQRGGSEFQRLCLHAWKISFRHPATKEQIELTCEPDSSFGHQAALILQSSATRS